MRLFLCTVFSALLVLPAGAADLDEAAPDIVGVWRLDFTTPDNVHRTPIVLVGRQQKELAAWYVEDEKPAPFEKVALEGETVVASLKPKEYGGDLTVTLEAWLDGENACRGKAEYAFEQGESGDWQFTGKRMTLKDLDRPERWEIAFTTPEYERHEALVTLVTMGDKTYGWYSGKQFELPILKATSGEGKRVISVEAKTADGIKVEVTFRGTVEGDKMSGDAEYKLESDTGSFAFSGKRKS